MRKILNKKNIFTISVLGLLIILIALFNKDSSHKKLLKQMYIVQDDTATFSVDTIYNKINNNIDIYNTSNIIDIYNILNLEIDKNYIKAIKERISLITNEEIQEMSLNNLVNLCKIYSYIDRSVLDKNILVESILKHFDEIDSLFFYENNNEKISFKITATNLAISCFYYIGYMPPEILKGLEESHIKLLNNDSYFTMNNMEVKKNLFNEGLVILNNIHILESFNKDIKNKANINIRKEWFNYWYDMVYDDANIQNSISIPTNVSIIDINTLASTFNKEIIIPKKYIDLVKEENIEEFINTDLQILKDIIQVISLEKSNSKFLQKLVENINLDILLYQKNFVEPIISEVFYGINLFDYYNVYYNKKYVKNYIDNFIENNTLDLNNTYWISLINEKLYNNYARTEEYEQIRNILKFELSNLNLTNLNTVELYYSCFLDKYYKVNKIDPTLLKDIINIRYEKGYQNSKELYFRVLIEHLYNFNFDLNKINICNDIKKFEDISGGFKGYLENNGSDILSTYRMLTIKKILGVENSREDKLKIRNYIEKMRGDRGGYFWIYHDKYDKFNQENYRENFTLESFWCGTQVLELIK